MSGKSSSLLIGMFVVLALSYGCVGGDEPAVQVSGPVDNDPDDTIIDNTQKPLEFARPHYKLPIDSDASFSVDGADFDMDGDRDVVIGNMGTPSRLLINKSGFFIDETDIYFPPDPPSSVREVAFFDFDNDIDQDIIFALSNGGNVLYRNNGETFDDVTADLLAGEADSMADTVRVWAGYINTDHYGDLFFINKILGPKMYFYNPATDVFDDVSYMLPQDDVSCRYTDAAFADINGDKKKDILITGTCAAVYLTEMDENNKVVYVKNVDILPSFPEESSNIALATIDKDSDIDIIVSSQEFIYIYRNDFGIFKLADIITAEGVVSMIVMTKINNDNYIDMYIGQGGNHIYMNNGKGVFALSTAPYPGSWERDNTKGITFGDFNNDEQKDIIAVNDGQNRLYINSKGLFSDQTALTELPADSDESFMGKVVNLDADDGLELVVANFGVNRIYDVSTLIDKSSLLPEMPDDRSYSVDVGDLNGDGMADIVFANDSSQNTFYLNLGGSFIDFTNNLPVEEDPSHDVDFGDVDGDGDLDMVISNIGTQNKLYLNIGAGKFSDVTSRRFPVDDDVTFHAALGDIDGDNDLDIVFANIGSKIKLYLNDSNGFFTDASSGLPDQIGGSDAVALGDLNGDDFLDIFVGNFPFSDESDEVGERNWVYINNKNGTFRDATASALPVIFDQSCNNAIVDIDSDGDLDLIASNQGQDRLYLNDGFAKFTDVTDILPPENDTTRGLVAADVDMDGDIDIIQLNDFNRQNHINWNLQN